MCGSEGRKAQGPLVLLSPLTLGPQTLKKNKWGTTNDYWKSCVYICNCYRPISIVENIWLKRLVLCQCPQVSFLYWTILVNEVFRGVVDTFALVINFLKESWNLINVSVGLFEVDETNGINMVLQFESLLQNLVWCILWLHSWKMKAIIWVPWQRHYFPSSFVNLWNLTKFMKVRVLGMWCLRCVNMITRSIKV